MTNRIAPTILTVKSGMYPTTKSTKLVRDLRAESRTLGQSWLSLQDEVDQLERHKVLLKQEWDDLEEERDRLEKETERFEKIVTQEWFPVSITAPHLADRVVKLNIGGQIFEITAALLLKDRFSLLAAACLPEEESILRPEADGFYFFDRDWFLFKYILTYLQNGTLPRDIFRLRELYHESGFYCLGSMQREIQKILADMEHKSPPKIENLQKQAIDKRIEKKKSNSERNHRQRRFSPSQELPDPYGFTSKSHKF